MTTSINEDKVNSVRITSNCTEGAGTKWDDGTRVFGAIHISYNYEIDCKSVYRTILFVWTSNAACRSQSSDNTKKDYKCIYRIITLSCLKMIWERSFCAACQSQSSYNTKKDYKFIYRIITLSCLKMIWERSFCIASNATCQSQSTDESKGDCGLLQSESLFAAALNRRSTSFQTLSHKTGVNANPRTGTNDA